MLCYRDTTQGVFVGRNLCVTWMEYEQVFALGKEMNDYGGSIWHAFQGSVGDEKLRGLGV